MGRVSRYKKVKSFDPFFRSKNGKKTGDNNFDLPPNQKNRGEKNKKRKENEKRIKSQIRQKLINQENEEKSKRDSTERVSLPSDNQVDDISFRNRRKGESLSAYKRDIQGQLGSSLKKMHDRQSKNKQKRKRFMQERSRKNKEKRKGRRQFDNQEEEFKFGERNDQPPDLSRFSIRKTRKKS